MITAGVQQQQHNFSTEWSHSSSWLEVEIQLWWIEKMLWQINWKSSHEHSPASSAHALSVTVTSTLFYSMLRRRCVLLLFIHHRSCRTIFLSGHHALSWDFRRGGRGGGSEEAPCLVSSINSRFSITLRSWSDLTWGRWNCAIFVHWTQVTLLFHWQMKGSVLR